MAEGKGLRGSTHLELYKLEGRQPAGSDRAMIPHHQQRANIVGNNDIGLSKTFQAFLNHIINFYLTRPDLTLKKPTTLRVTSVITFSYMYQYLLYIITLLYFRDNIVTVPPFTVLSCFIQIQAVNYLSICL